MSQRRVLVGPCVALAVVIAAACGTGDDSAFEQIDSDELAGLDQTTTTSTTTTTTTTTTIPSSSLPEETTTTASTTTIPSQPVELYFISGNQLDRVIQNLAGDPSLQRVMSVLEDGCRSGEVCAGLRSLVPAELITTVRESGEGYAEVDLAGEAFEDIEDRDQRLAIAQIVLTLTRRPGIGQVRFTLDGELLAVPGRGGVQTAPGEDVSSLDYEELLAAPDTPSSEPDETVEPTVPIDSTPVSEPTTPST